MAVHEFNASLALEAAGKKEEFNALVRLWPGCIVAECSDAEMNKRGADWLVFCPETKTTRVVDVKRIARNQRAYWKTPSVEFPIEMRTYPATRPQNSTPGWATKRGLATTHLVWLIESEEPGGQSSLEVFHFAAMQADALSGRVESIGRIGRPVRNNFRGIEHHTDVVYVTLDQIAEDFADWLSEKV